MIDDLHEAIAIIGIIVLIILFSGTPDLMDAILYNLTGGKIELPK